MQTGYLGRSVLAIAILAGACGKSEDPAEYARKQAEEAQKDKFKEPAVRVKVPVVGGKKIACADLIPSVEPFTRALGQEVRLEDFNTHSRQKDASAVCKFIHAGERPSKEEQEKLLIQHGKLGVLGGDPYCEIRAYCSLPDQPDFEQKCRERSSGHNDLGVFACVTISQRGPADAYRYKLIEPDTKCVLDILGGDSVVGDEIVRACAAAALEAITADSIKAYQQ
jgi:hypothetical protein